MESQQSIKFYEMLELLEESFNNYPLIELDDRKSIPSEEVFPYSEDLAEYHGSVLNYAALVLNELNISKNMITKMIEKHQSLLDSGAFSSTYVNNGI